MREITCTCPFTGLEFNALENEETGTISYKNPLTGCNAILRRGDHIEDTKRYYALNIEDTTHVPIVKAYDAKEILGVSKQRIAQIIANDTIPVKRINGEPYFLKSDVLDYRENRAVGAPRKDK